MAKATPQQQAVKDRIVLQALRFILDDQTAADFVRQAKQDPVEAMVNVTSVALKHIKDAASTAGREYVGDPKFLLGAAKEIMNHELRMLVTFKIIDEQQGAQAMQQALQELASVIGGGGQPQQPQQPQPQGMLAQGA